MAETVDFLINSHGATPIGPKTPFRIALIGDWTGRHSRNVTAEGGKLAKPVTVDRDNVDTLPGKMGVKLDLPIPGTANNKMTLSFGSLEDFEPDHLFERLELFAELRKVRRQLQGTSTFDTAAQKVRTWGQFAESHPVFPPSDPPNLDIPEGNLLDAVLASTPERGDDWESAIQAIVGPYIKPSLPPDQKQYLAVVDQAISDQMAAILHHADFQNLEANWRGLDRLVRNLETDNQLRVCLLDVSRSEIESDAKPLYKILLDNGPGVAGGDPWALLVGAFSFEGTQADARTLMELGKIAASLAAPFVASAGSALVGCSDLAATSDADDWGQPTSADEWEELRTTAEANWLCLTFPRYLLRLPYGKDSHPTENFALEEMGGIPEHRHYLWGNGGFLAAEMLGIAFTEDGWDIDLTVPTELSAMPVHFYRDEDGDTATKPVAEILLPERAIERVVAVGLTPLVSVRGQDVVRIPGLRSLAKSGSRLSGKWG